MAAAFVSVATIRLGLTCFLYLIACNSDHLTSTAGSAEATEVGLYTRSHLNLNSIWYAKKTSVIIDDVIEVFSI